MIEGMTLIGTLERGKGSLIQEREVLSYREIPAVMHKFTTILHLGTTFKLVEFLAMQQVVEARDLAEEHTERQMIQYAIAGLIELEEENALSKIG